MHGDAKYRVLSRPRPNGQTLWTHLLHGPHTMSLPGLSLAGEAMLAEALGWDLKGFRNAFDEVRAQSMAEADWDARVVWVPNAIKYNPPDNPNVVKSWGKLFDTIPECALKDKAREQLKAFIDGLGEGFAIAFAEGFAERYGESPAPAPTTTPTTRKAERAKPRSRPVDDSPMIGGFTLKDNSLFRVTELMAAPWPKAYPHCDIGCELAKMDAWCFAHPERRKTRRGALKFATGWLARAEESAKAAPPKPREPVDPGPEYWAQDALRIQQEEDRKRAEREAKNAGR